MVMGMAEGCLLTYAVCIFERLMGDRSTDEMR